MKHLMLFLSAILSTSCSSTYFFPTIDPDGGMAIKNQTGEMIVENDSVSITYSFNGYSAPVWMSIYNKLDKPLMVDWQRSFLIIDDVASSLIKSDIPFQAQTDTDYNESVNSVTGNMNLSETISYIPPKTKIEYNGYEIENLDFTYIPNKEYAKIKIQNKKDHSVDAHTIEFLPENSPLSFRSYITLLTETDKDKPLVIDQGFYISRLLKSKSLKPKNMPENMLRRGDLFYTVKEANNTVWQGIAVGAVVAVPLVIGLTYSSDIPEIEYDF